jgi:hypothetical protein
MQLFTKQLAYTNRQHNYDKKDKNGIEYDDLEGDKPSCYSGVNRNLFQSLHKHSVMQLQSFVTLTELNEALQTCVYDFYKEYFEGLNDNALAKLKKSTLKYLIEQEPLPSIPNIPEEKIKALKSDLNVKYAGKQVQGFKNINTYVDNSFNASDTANSHFMKFYGQFSLATLLQERAPHQNSAREFARSSLLRTALPNDTHTHTRRTTV